MVDVSKYSKIKWKGKWIWLANTTPNIPLINKNYKNFVDDMKKDLNRFVLIRKTFQIDKKVDSAILDITADSRYKLFINGKYVDRGINRCESFYWYFNRYNVLQFLKKGKNVIAIHARYYGVDFAYYNRSKLAGNRKSNSGKGAVLFELNLKYKDGTNDWIFSDKNCKIKLNEAEKQDVPLKNDALGFVEEFDSRKMPKNWNEVDYEERAEDGWKAPEIYDYPIKTLILDPNAPLHEHFCLPQKILQIGTNDDISFDEDMDEEDLEEMDFCIQHMLEGPYEPNEDFEIINQEILISESPNANSYCEIRPKDSKEAHKKVLSIFLKFEKEMVGYPQLIVEGEEGTIIDIIPTEKMKDNLPLLDFINQKRGSRFILRGGGKQFFEQWDWEGFLYMLIKIRNLRKPLKIYQIATNCTHMRISQKGSFKCCDSDLNDLYDACAYTLLCCAIDGYLDCPSREQRSYLGDAYTEALIANTCFGEPRLTKKLIYDTAFGQRTDGITFSFHPGDYELQCHIIPDYCFYWIQIADDYLKWYGDYKIIDELYLHFVHAIEWFLKYIDPKMGLIGEELPYWIFIDWSFKSEKPGFNAIINTQFMDVLYIVSKYAEHVGDKRRSQKFKEQADKMRKKIDELFWDPSEGCYRDYIKDGKFGETISQHTNAYLVIKGVAPPEKWHSILDRVFLKPDEQNDYIQIDAVRESHVKHDKLKFDPKKNILIAQPFFMHYVNRFFALMNRFDLMFKYFKKGWIPMTKLGETKTIWETWSRTGSECHAWAASPGYDLPTYILGVAPIKNGFKKFKIEPNLYNLEWAKGSIPSIKGLISVNWQLTESSFEIEFNVPNDCSADFYCPNLSNRFRIEEILLNGRTIDIESINSSDKLYSRYEFILNDLKEGNYRILIKAALNNSKNN
ncbi:MAG: alpha-L-rhamnosidase-related protein [Promethearchaeota archaeon]